MNQEPQNQEVNGKFHGFTSNTLQFVLRFVNFVFITGLRNILSRLFTILLYVVLNFLVVGPILPPSSGHAQRCFVVIKNKKGKTKTKNKKQ